MNAIRLLATAIMICGLLVSARAEDKTPKPDNAKLLVGKWEVTRADRELPVGAVIEFTRDGKMKITAKNRGKEENVDAVYTVKGDKIDFTLKLGEKEEKKDPLTIKKISEEELVLEGKNGKRSVQFAFKRKK